MRIIRVSHKGRAFYASLAEDGSLTCLQPGADFPKNLHMEEVELIMMLENVSWLFFDLGYTLVVNWVRFFV